MVYTERMFADFQMLFRQINKIYRAETQVKMNEDKNWQKIYWFSEFSSQSNESIMGTSVFFIASK